MKKRDLKEQVRALEKRITSLEESLLLTLAALVSKKETPEEITKAPKFPYSFDYTTHTYYK